MLKKKKSCGRPVEPADAISTRKQYRFIEGESYRKVFSDQVFLIRVVYNIPAVAEAGSERTWRAADTCTCRDACKISRAPFVNTTV